MKPTEFRVGADATVEVDLTSADHLVFDGKAFISDAGIGFSVALRGAWTNPFGLHGVTVQQPSLALTLSPILIPDEFGISGGVTVGSVTGLLDVYASLVDVTSSVFVAEVESSSFANVATSAGQMDPSSVSKIAGSLSLGKFALSVNPSLSPVPAACSRC